jgi:hypothetical protein
MPFTPDASTQPRPLLEEAEFITSKEVASIPEFFSTEEMDPKKLVLNPVQLNNLVLSYLVGPAVQEHHYHIGEGRLETEGNKIVRYTDYKQLSKENQAPLFVFQTVCDAKGGRGSLAFINDVLKAFFENNRQVNRENARLLLPMAQCSFVLGIQKQHYVLVEITPEKIMLHDSKSRGLLASVYNYFLNGFPGSVIYKNYGQQTDDFSCGLYAYHYTRSIIKEGNSDQLNALQKVTLHNMLSNPALLKDMLIANFSQAYGDRYVKGFDSGEEVPWQEKYMDLMLKKKHRQQPTQSATTKALTSSELVCFFSQNKKIESSGENNIKENTAINKPR